MGLFSDIIDFLREYYVYDEITEKTTKRDYLGAIQITGLYPKVDGKFAFVAAFQIIFTFINLILHCYLATTASLLFIDDSFTLATFYFQLALLLMFCSLLILLINIRRTDFNTVHREMIYDVFKYENEDKEILEELSKEMSSEKRILLLLPFLVSVAGFNALISGPILDTTFGSFEFNGTRFEGRSWSLPLPVPYHPFTENGKFGYYVAAILEGMVAMQIMSLLGTAGFLFAHMTQVSCLNIKYLSYNVDHLQDRAEIMYRSIAGAKSMQGKDAEDGRYLYDDPMFVACYQKCLKRTFKHHQLILKWVSCVQEIVGTPLGMAYFTGSIVIALSLLCIKTGTSLPGTLLTCLLMCGGETGFMALLSLFGQRITDLSEELRFKLYSTKWYYFPKTLNLDVEIFQEITQRPMKLTGFGIITANNDTFANVMNSAYTYYNLIMAF